MNGSDTSASFTHVHAGPSPENHLINLLRFGAALAVVCSHARTVLFVDYDAAPHNFLLKIAYGVTALGKEAVTVFFVLSGFWVGGAAIRKVEAHRFYWRDYLSDRAIRLWLVLLPGLVLTAVLDGIGLQFFPEASVYTGDARYQGVIGADPFPHSAWLFGLNTVFLQGLFVLPYGTNASLWSVGYEFWMYAVGAAIIMFAYRRSMTALLIAVVLFAASTVAEPDRFPSYMLTWLLGAAVARSRPIIRHAAARWSYAQICAARLTSALALLVGAVVVRGLSASFEVGLVVVGSLTAVLIATLITGDDADRTDSSFRFASYLAAFSFSLYVIHLPLIVFFAATMGIDVQHRWQPHMMQWFAFSGVISGLVLLAWAFAGVTERHTASVRAAIKTTLRSREMQVG